MKNSVSNRDAKWLAFETAVSTLVSSAEHHQSELPWGQSVVPIG